MNFKLLPIFVFLAVFAQFNLANAAPLGQVQSFFVDSEFSENGKTELKATLRFEGPRAHFFVDDEYFNSLNSNETSEVLNSLKKISKEYNEKIYPILTEKFGNIRSPGIDGDEKVYILFFDLKKGNGGYVNTADAFLKTQVNRDATNEKEIIYLNSDFINKDYVYSFFAHEFQHLISINNKEVQKNIAEDIWLNELRSEYALEFLGYNSPYKNSFLESRVKNFSKSPWDSLTEWQNDSADYAVVSVFSQYLADNYGDNIFKEMIQSDSVGIASINDALKKLGYTVSFSDVFKKWQITNYLSQKNIFLKDSKYLNPNISFQIEPAVSYQVSDGDNKGFSYLLKDWQQSWIKYFGDTEFLNIEFEGKNEGVFDMTYILNEKNGNISIGDMDIKNNKGSLALLGLGSKIKDIILIPTSKTKLSDFSDDEPKRNFIIKITTKSKNSETNIVTQKIQRKLLPDGSLVRPAWDFKVYVVKGGYLRYIKNEKILNFYDASSIVVLSREEFDFYKESSLVLAEGDFKVYQINPDGTKHWLNMTAEKFLKGGRTFDSVFKISRNELKLYKEGFDIFL